MKNQDPSKISFWALCCGILLAATLLACLDVADSAYQEFHDVWSQTWSSPGALTDPSDDASRDVSAMALDLL